MFIQPASLRSRDAHLCRQVKVPSSIGSLRAFALAPPTIDNQTSTTKFAITTTATTSTTAITTIRTTRKRRVEQEDERNSKSDCKGNGKGNGGSRKLAWVVLDFFLWAAVGLGRSTGWATCIAKPGFDLCCQRMVILSR